MELQGLRIMASLSERLLQPNNPFNLWPKEEASFACSAIIIALLTLKTCTVLMLRFEQSGRELDAFDTHLFKKGGDKTCGLKCA